MRDDLETRVAAIDHETLTPIVRQALNADADEILEWEVQPIHGGSFGTVYRFVGGVGRVGSTLPWSLILKVVHTSGDEPIDRGAPSNIRYWKREPLAYQSGFLADLPGDLVAPRCFGVVEQSEDEFWLWLEDVADDGAPWSMERYGLAANHFGRFNAQCLVDGNLPAGVWLGRELLRAQAKDAGPTIHRLPASLKRPLVRRFFPPEVAEGIYRLWEERETFLGVVDGLPQTANHRDAFRRNLFGRRTPDGVEQTVAIDWEDVGVGPVGEEMVSLVVLAPATHEIEMGAVQDLEAHVFPRYLEGLSDGGWQSASQVVRLGYTLGYMRYAFGLPMILLARATDESRHADQEQTTGRSMSEIADHWAAVLRFVFARIDEARILMRVAC